MAVFRTQGLRILDTNDSDFIPVGVNMATSGSDGGLGVNKTHLQVSADALKAWDCNTVRLVDYVTARNSWSVWNKAGGYNGKAAGLASVVEVSRQAVDMYRANGIVVMLEAHDFTDDIDSDTPANIALWQSQVVAYWTEMAKLYKTDSGVWFNIYNEPCFINADYVAKHDECMTAIRAEGASNIIVVDAPRWGQDIPTSGQDQGFLPHMAPALNAEHGNVVYSMHHYGGQNGWWGTPSNFNRYMDSVAAVGLPLVIGEIGWPRAAGWSPTWSNCRNGGMVTLSEAPKRGVGILWWAGAHNDEFDLHYDRVSNTSCEIWDTLTTSIPLSDGGQAFKRYTLRMAGKLTMPTLDVVTPSGLGKLTKAAVNANTDGLRDAISALGGGLAVRSSLTASSPHSDVRPYLPPIASVPTGRIRTQNTIRIDASTSFPIRATWTEPSLLKLVIQNPATNTSDLNLGYGVYGTNSHTTEPVVVPPGSEWIGDASPLPVYCRFTTGTGYITVISERSA